MNTTIKFTQDGRKVEVIGTAICLDGHYEADIYILDSLGHALH